MNLLLIDDNPDQITITKRALKHFNAYRIDTALDAPEGLRKLLNHPYDAVLCDYRLPSMSGVEVLKKLKEQNLEVPFIIVTAAGNERIAVEAMQRGAYDYVVKDAAYEEILPGIIQRAVDRWRETQERKRLEAERDQAQTALQASYEQLKELVQFKDELIAKVSHEFRTPLTSVKEGLALLLDRALGPLTPEQQEYLGVINRDIDRLTELIINVLDISKSEAGKMKLQHLQVDVRQLIEMTIQSFHIVKGNRTITVDGLPGALVFVDPHRMLQVFSNLLSNAIKFTADDGTITFRIDRLDDWISVSIQDNGRGISSQDLPKLFQKFLQVGPRDPNQPRGTGLGLVLCKELVELHQGHIDVASGSGRGTTFTVSLPTHSPNMMLTESFRELQAVAGFEKQETIGLIALQVESPASIDVEVQQSRLRGLVEQVRRLIRCNDVVLEMGSSWIVVLAITTPDGFQAVAQRLSESLMNVPRLRIGSAVYPVHGTEVAELFAYAKSRSVSMSQRLGSRLTD